MEHYLKKELYELVKKDESIFDFIQEGSLDGLWYWDIEKPENEWMNPRFWTVLGYNPDEMPHKASAWQDIINPEDLKVALDNFQKHVANPKHPYDQEVRYTHKKGTIVWVRCRGLAIRNTAGKVIRMLGAHQDITQLKETEQQLLAEKEATRKSEEKYRTLYEQAPFAFQSLDADGKIIDINPKWLDVLGYNREEVLGKPFSYFLHKDHIKRFETNFPKLKKQEQRKDAHYKIRKKDGAFIFAAFEGCIALNSKGEFLHTYCTFKDITLEKIAEIKLKESEARYRQISDLSTDYSYAYCISERGIASLEWAFGAFEEITGYPTQDMHNIENISKIIHPDDAQQIKERSKKLRIGETVVSIYRIITKAGQVKWMQSKSVPELDSITKKIIRIVCTAQEITKQKQTELELIKQRDLFELVINTVPARIFWKDLNSVYLGCNTHFATDAGMKRIENVIGKDDHDMVWKANAKKYRADDLLVINSGKSKLNYEEEFINTTGEKVVWRTNKIPLKNTDGKTIGIIATSENITFEKKAADQLKENEEKLRLSIDNSPLGICTNDMQGNFVSTNSAYEKIVGYSKEELQELSFFDITHPDYLPKNHELFNAMASNKSPGFNIDNKYIHKDGKVIDVRIHAGTITNTKGEAMFGMAFTEDITDRKLFEQKIVQQNEDFETLNKELHQTNSELFSEKQKAEESNRLKTEFLHNMSHEIRTPMNGIIGFSDLLAAPDLNNNKIAYYTSIIQNSSAQLLRVIDDILEISTLETKQINVINEAFNLNDFIHELFSVYDLKSKERKIPLYIKKQFHDNNSQIISDKSKLHKIITNLLDNAFKFTNDGFIELGYYLDDANLLVYVKDTGLGISSKNKERIFLRFSQEDATIAQSHGGLGLGLSIAKENAQLLGGNIFVESEKEKGSTFFISIPYKPVNKTAKANNKQAEQNKTNDKKLITILVAEDEEVNYLYLETILQNNNTIDFSLIHAINGKEAVDICLRNNKIDFVLMDIKMPVMNGYEATEKIKAVLPSIPIIAQTAYSTQADKNLALKHGCDYFISKPIKKAKLMDLLIKYIE